MGGGREKLSEMVVRNNLSLQERGERTWEEGGRNCQRWQSEVTSVSKREERGHGRREGDTVRDGRQRSPQSPGKRTCEEGRRNWEYQI